MKVKKLKDNAIIPTQGSVDAAGWDLYSTGCYSINPGGMVKISTGLAFEIPKNNFGGVFPRSGYATKKGLRLANCVAVIDSDYRGEVLVPLYNDSNEVQHIDAGDRIAQMVILPFTPVDMEETNELNETERGEGGFGHTGK
jgi:dUTP pyrophosphatase